MHSVKKKMQNQKKNKEHKQASVDKYQARIDEANAAIKVLKSEVATLSEEISEINSSQEKATSIRNTEHSDYLAASKDFKEAAEAITQALVVLKDFYKGDSSFMQTSQGPEFGGAKDDSAHGILEILEVAEADFTRLLAEAETSESEALESYKALTQENKVSKSKKEAR